jgi:phosphoglycerate dehydrogenase-like enzyme
MRPELPARLFGAEGLDRLCRVLELDPAEAVTHFGDVDPQRLASIEVLITGWGSPQIGPHELDRMPRLRAIFHAAGTVKAHISPAAWERGVIVTSAADANAQPVAEYTLAAILMSGKGVPDIADAYARDPAASGNDREDIGNYQRTVGIIGASRIGRRVIALLQPFDVTVLLYDPHLTAGDPVEQLAERTELNDLMRRASVVSVHAPLLPETVGMIGREQLELMPAGAVLINTARAPIVDQDALIDAVRDRGIRAVLDVTDPEPLPADHPLRSLPGVFLTPHVAGALGNELRRLGESALGDIELFSAGSQPLHAITKEALVAMA